MFNHIAIANHKGGVGKSTTVMMIAEGLAYFCGLNVLVVDLDPQGSISRMLLGQAKLDQVAQERQTVIDVLTSQGFFGRRFVFAPSSSNSEIPGSRSSCSLDVLPMHASALQDVQSLFQEMQARKPRRTVDRLIADLLRKVIEKDGKKYDVVLFDCPAGASPFTLAALRLSSYLVAPTVLEQNSLNSLVDFVKYLLSSDPEIYSQFKGRLYLLMTMFVRANPMQQMLAERIQSGLAGLDAIAMPVTLSTAIQRAALHPGPYGSRTMREKYGASHDEVKELAHSIQALVSADQRRRA